MLILGDLFTVVAFLKSFRREGAIEASEGEDVAFFQQEAVILKFALPALDRDLIRVSVL
jgi:hypothetical protein